ncbi:MAG: YncE family protein [Verrucomicrobiales bacterium]
MQNGKLHVIPFESNNRTQLSGCKKEDIDGKLVTFDAEKLAAAFDSAGFTVDGSGNVFIANTDARNHVNGRAGTKKHSLKELDNRPYLNRVTKVPAEGQPECFHLNPLPPEQPSRKDAVATPFRIKSGGDGRTLFITGAGSDHLVSLDAQTGETLARLKLEAVPRGIALTMVGMHRAQSRRPVRSSWRSTWRNCPPKGCACCRCGIPTVT